MLDFNQILEHEQTLDPHDWQAMKQLAHRMVDDMFDYLQNIRQEPVWRQPTEQAKANLNQPLPVAAEPIENIYREFCENILPFPKGNIHPRFWSWVQGTGTPFAMMAEMLAAGTNPNVTIGDHAAMYVDSQVIDWCKQMMNYPAAASGLLVSGGSMANITALVIARNAHGEQLVRKQGLSETRMVLYASTETHSCIQKAAEVCGLGSEAVRQVRVQADYRMDTAHLRQRIAQDKADGFTPFCVVGNAGTVNTGAIDPLDEMLAVCREENLWFHIDGAFGALAKLVPEYQPALQPLEQADSVAFDLHKWMYLPYEVGCLLVKDKDLHRNAFALQPNYLLSHERGLAAGPDSISNYGMELSRGFKALKVWMSLKEHGIGKFAQLIRQNIAQAFYLGSLIEKESLLELLTPVTMNVVCFRFNPQTLPESELNALNKEILMRLQEEGVAAPSYTLLHGKYAIRVANVNHRSRKEDFNALVENAVRLGTELIKTENPISQQNVSGV
jgi:glutamate/tyrosine decarboxylase-like PLP-dependent enzyme